MELVFDTDVLVSLGCAQNGIVDAVERAWGGALVVTETVHSELKWLTQRRQSLGCASFLLSRNWVKSSVSFTDAEMNEVETIRRQLAGVRAGEHEHAGESSVLVYRMYHPIAILVLQDRDARRKAESMGFEYWYTLEVFENLVAAGQTDCSTAHSGYTSALRVSGLREDLTQDSFCCGGCPTHQPMVS